MTSQGKKLSRADLERQLDHCRTTCRNHWLGRGFTSLCRAVMWIAIAGFGYLSVSEMAGKQTLAHIDVKALAGLSRGGVEGKVVDEKSIASQQMQEVSVEVRAGAEPFLPDGWANILCILFGVGGLLYGRRQAEFRRSVVERYHPIMVEYEKRSDPGRVSSDMPPRGGTRSEDA